MSERVPPWISGFVAVGLFVYAAPGCSRENPTNSPIPTAGTPSTEVGSALARLATPTLPTAASLKADLVASSPTTPDPMSEILQTVPLSSELASRLGNEFLNWWDRKEAEGEILDLLSYGDRGVYATVIANEGLKKRSGPGLEAYTLYHQPWFYPGQDIQYDLVVRRVTERGLERWFLYEDTLRNIFNEPNYPIKAINTFGAERIGTQRFVTITNNPPHPVKIDLRSKP